MTNVAATTRDWLWAILVVALAIALWALYRWTRQPFPIGIVEAETAAIRARAEARDLVATTSAEHAVLVIEAEHKATIEKIDLDELDTVRKLRDDPEALAEELARLGVALRRRP